MTAKRQSGQSRSERAIPPDRLFLGVPEVSAILRLDDRTVRGALASGEIPGFKVGPQWHVPAAWVRQQLGDTTETVAPREAEQGAVTPEELADLVADRVVNRLVQALTGVDASSDAAPRRLKRAGSGPEAA